MFLEYYLLREIKEIINELFLNAADKINQTKVRDPNIPVNDPVKRNKSAGIFDPLEDKSINSDINRRLNIYYKMLNSQGYRNNFIFNLDWHQIAIDYASHLPSTADPDLVSDALNTFAMTIKNGYGVNRTEKTKNIYDKLLSMISKPQQETINFLVTALQNRIKNRNTMLIGKGKFYKDPITGEKLRYQNKSITSGSSIGFGTEARGTLEDDDERKPGKNDNIINFNPYSKYGMIDVDHLPEKEKNDDHLRAYILSSILQKLKEQSKTGKPGLKRFNLIKQIIDDLKSSDPSEIISSPKETPEEKIKYKIKKISYDDIQNLAPMSIASAGNILKDIKLAAAEVLHDLENRGEFQKGLTNSIINSGGIRKGSKFLQSNVR